MKYLTIGLVILNILFGIGFSYQKYKIENLTEELTEVQINYGICAKSITDQNIAINKMSADRNTLENHLIEANNVNKKIIRENKRIKEELNSKPLSLTCSDQMLEVREISKIMKEWSDK